MLGIEMGFPLLEEHPIKGANLLCVVPEGESWSIDESSRKAGIVILTTKGL